MKHVYVVNDKTGTRLEASITQNASLGIYIGLMDTTDMDLKNSYYDFNRKTVMKKQSMITPAPITPKPQATLDELRKMHIDQASIQVRESIYRGFTTPMTFPDPDGLITCIYTLKPEDQTMLTARKSDAKPYEYKVYVADYTAQKFIKHTPEQFVFVYDKAQDFILAKRKVYEAFVQEFLTAVSEEELHKKYSKFMAGLEKVQ